MIQLQLQEAHALIDALQARRESPAHSRDSTSSDSGDSGNHTPSESARRRRADRRRAAKQREEREWAERQQDRDDRRAERMAELEERRAARHEEREDRRALAEQLATLNTGGRAQYRIGLAAKDFRSFDGEEEGAAYILELTHLLGAHQVPVAMWARELNLKLSGKAANWYAAKFPDFPAGSYPPWSDLYAGMLLAYSQSYGAAGAY